MAKTLLLFISKYWLFFPSAKLSTSAIIHGKSWWPWRYNNDGNLPRNVLRFNSVSYAILVEYDESDISHQRGFCCSVFLQTEPMLDELLIILPDSLAFFKAVFPPKSAILRTLDCPLSLSFFFLDEQTLDYQLQSLYYCFDKFAEYISQWQSLWGLLFLLPQIFSFENKEETMDSDKNNELELLKNTLLELEQSLVHANLPASEDTVFYFSFHFTPLFL